jgi:hypothetical protein
MTLRFERGAEVAGQSRFEALPALLLPLESSVIELTIEGRAAQRIDRASFALVPARARYRVGALSPVTKLLTLGVGEIARTRTCREYRPHVDPIELATIVGAPRLLSRTRWFDELANRYLFERDVCEKHASAAARFLETEITKELFFLGKEALADKTRASVVHEGSDVVRRARQWIEDHLFSPLPIEESSRSDATRARRRSCVHSARSSAWRLRPTFAIAASTSRSCSSSPDATASARSRRVSATRTSRRSRPPSVADSRAHRRPRGLHAREASAFRPTARRR